MINKKITLGLTALAASLLLAMGTTNNSQAADWTGRTASAPYAPAGVQLNRTTDCDLDHSSEICGYEFTQQNQYVGTIPGRYTSED